MRFRLWEEAEAAIQEFERLADWPDEEDYSLHALDTFVETAY